ncbi:type I restriction-modification system, R subunit [Cyanobium sp. PCC 7001]|uniref:type I restriction-modification system endonuclease n=1 Tax=Cyanobium sp. PCC 7001 TaxID=180281 RepID=UPI0001804E11|nr:type I restriction-modification system endonuclease [Cyanobium sp. PCC 7001]EDY37381.1 type I restriction-modification system, R subunit [Cyanobium sp. PCC 7001]
MSTNFLHLRPYDEQLFRLGVLAERYFPEDPNTCLIKLRQLGERLAQEVASRFGVYGGLEETQQALIRRLQLDGQIERDVADLFHNLRRSGNRAAHDLAGDHAMALSNLKIAWQLGLWFHRTFGDPAFRSGPFRPPQAPLDESEALRQELAALQAAVTAFQADDAAQAQQLKAMEEQLQAALAEQQQWEQLAEQVEADKAALAERLQELQNAASQQTPAVMTGLRQAAQQAAQAIHLDEAATRQLIDEQLRAVGWEADTQQLRYSQGTRPQKNRNLAIAEWPTSSGPADYVLFAGLTPLAAVEAKAIHKNVAGVLAQAERYCRDLQPSGDAELSSGGWGPTGEFRLPFAFSTNGRPFLPQLRTGSGIWFRDLRRAQNLAGPLDGWYSPDGLSQLARQNAAEADAQLQREPFTYGFGLRPYQRRAIQAVEGAIAAGQRELLVAMATGTGKTKTCVALIYRLLKTGRFRRVLFLVDRSELGNQAADAFKDTRMESLQTFADIFGIKELGEREAESDTRVHIATVQAMVQRVLLGDDDTRPTVDTYDLIVVDECHRGYLLDRELSDRELRFRDFNDYVSKYRRVLERFDAVKIGLTATPALHTVEIFGEPVFVYSYREAVVDGYLVDHEPAQRIHTELSRDGIHWQAGEQVPVLDPQTGQMALFHTPDALDFEVEAFNRRVLTEPFNREVCRALADQLDVLSPHKTLIFCASDAHADLVVDLLKQALQERYGDIDDDVVAKITGASDRPQQLIRRYKNEARPNVAVTVDLLSTGVDVPAISTIVFLRRMNSRILYDQMVGRATRLCPEIGKTLFRIFDAVGIYEALQDYTAMKPVVQNPQIPLSQLVRELIETPGEGERELVRDQLIARLRRKLSGATEQAEAHFRELTGEEPEAFLERLRTLPITEASGWIGRLPGLGELLDQSWSGPPQPVFVADQEDQLLGVEPAYGEGQRPQDYLEGFTAFIRDAGNDLPALTTVLQRPWELSRQDLRALKLALDARGYSETSLAAAWRHTTNQEMAASIMGYIRQAALGDPLVPYAERVERALQRILASRNWTAPQRQWLQRIANQTKAITIVDREAIDDDALLFRREGGGWPRLNKLFGGELEQVLQRFNEAVWEAA